MEFTDGAIRGVNLGYSPSKNYIVLGESQSVNFLLTVINIGVTPFTYRVPIIYFYDGLAM